MANLSPKKNPMPEQEPLVRNKNFQEVATGYTQEMAMDEAQRCLNCKKMPCVSGCPVNVRIPEFIAKVAAGEFEAAYEIITSTNSLPAVCGRVCPQENQCEGQCVRGKKGEPVGVGRLERFVADWHAAHSTTEPQPVPSNGHRVAIIGSGPAGLTCAGDLVKQGYDVTIFEAFHKAGGVLVYGIPEFRLPKAIVQAEVDNLQKMGVKVVTNAVIGRAMSIDELFEDGFEAVFIGSGAGLPQFLHIPGENLRGVVVQGQDRHPIHIAVPPQHVPADQGQGVGQDGHHVAVLLDVLGHHAAHESPAADVAHPGDEGKKVIVHWDSPLLGIPEAPLPSPRGRPRPWSSSGG